LNFNLAAGGTVAGTYTRTDANGVVYYDRGDGVLAQAASNARYLHSLFGMYFEVASQNFLLHSLDQNNAYWTKTNTASAVSADLAPDGVGLATKVTLSSGVGASYRVGRAAISKSASAIRVITASCYVKAGSLTKIAVRVNSNSVAANRIDASFNLLNGGSVISVTSSGAYSSAKASVTTMANGWVRVECSCTSSTEAQVEFNVYALDSGNNLVFNTSGGEHFLMWGAQLEELTDVATTLMASVASQATRSAPSLSYPVTAYDLVPDPALSYTAVADIVDVRTVAATGINGRVFQIVGETDRILRKVTATANFAARFGTANAVGAVAQRQLVRLTQSVNIGTANKLAMEGSVIGTQALTPAVTGAATSLRIGSSGANTDIFHGFIKRIGFMTGHNIA
jgi:hypothetical protein